MKRTRTLLILLLSLLPLFLTLLVFPLFPQEIPLGNSWENKYFQLLLPGVLLLLGLGGLLSCRLLIKHGRASLIPRISGLLLYLLSAGLIIHIAITFGTYWHISLSTFSAMQSQSFDLMQVVCLGVSVLAMVMGNRLPKRPFHDALGIRTRWTLRDREIWRKTHSLAGPILVFSGILGLVFCVFFTGWLLGGLCLLLLLIPFITAFIYSSSLWKKKFR